MKQKLFENLRKNPAKAGKKARQIVISVVRHVFLIGLSYVVLYPLLYMLSNAFKPVEQYYDPSIVWIPKSLTLDNFYIVSLVMDIGAVLKETLITEILPAFISTAVCMMVGYGLAQFRFKGRGLVTAAVILTIIVPPQTISASLYSSYRYFDFLGILELLHNVIPKIGTINLIGTSWVTILPALLGVGLKSGIFIFIYMQFFTGLPKELQEAAAIDGAGEWTIFRRITLPMTTPILAVNALNSFIAAYNSWEWAFLVCQKESHWTLAVWMYQMSQQFAGQPWCVMAGFVLVSIPTAVVFLACQKVILRGIVLPSMK